MRDLEIRVCAIEDCERHPEESLDTPVRSPRVHNQRGRGTSFWPNGWLRAHVMADHQNFVAAEHLLTIRRRGHDARACYFVGLE